MYIKNYIYIIKCYEFSKYYYFIISNQFTPAQFGIEKFINFISCLQSINFQSFWKKKKQTSTVAALNIDP